MKHAKKLASFLLVLVMVFALATTAFAADTTITAPAGSTHTYDVYQIFTGDLAGGVLSNVKWGKNGTGAVGKAVPQETLDALAAVNILSDTEKLAEISKYVNLTSEKFGTSTVNGSSPLCNSKHIFFFVPFSTSTASLRFFTGQILSPVPSAASHASRQFSSGR